MSAFIITATDTDVGKTLVSAMLVRALNGVYWKPIQCGADPETDIQAVKDFTQFADNYFLPEVYSLVAALSPHRAAELEGVEIDVGKILSTYHAFSHSCVGGNPDDITKKKIPAYAGMTSAGSGTLIIEGAGGLMVPITRHLLQIDLFRQIGAPLILVARTGLGTINHTLLSIEAIRARGLVLHGIIFTGPDNADNIQTIMDFSGAKILGHLPQLTAITPTLLDQTFAAHFHRADFISV